jgi:hypothetical protein
MFKSPEAAKTISNIVESWKNLLDASYRAKNTFTTSTVSSMTTALKTFSLLASEIIQGCITPAERQSIGQLLRASIAEPSSSDTTGTCKSIETFAQELATLLSEKRHASNAAKDFIKTAGIASSVLASAITSQEESICQNLEPITMARKPLDGTLAANTLRHGCGGINVDGCRVGLETIYHPGHKPQGSFAGNCPPDSTGSHKWNGNKPYTKEGRWPANLVHDGSDEVVGLFPESNGQQGKVTGKEPSSKTNAIYGDFNGRPATNPREDSGSAARFFYCAKASDREILPAEEHPLFGESYAAVNNTHPTVKPVDLMRWLIRLVTPPGGVLLEPFMGSGTTLVAAKLEGRRAVGIEINPEYCEIAKNRLRQKVLGFDIET